MLHFINRPAEDDLLRATGGVAFAELLKVDWFLPCNVVLIFRAEEFDDWRERDVASSAAVPLALLRLYG